MLKRIVICTLLVLLGGLACSQQDRPVLIENKSLITIKFNRLSSDGLQGMEGEKGEELGRVLAVVDSIVVKVFHNGSSGELETYRGAAIPNGTDSIVVSVAVSPEIGKRVSVELFELNRLIYYGVDEDVDVYLGKETHVTIAAFSFELSGFRVSGSYILAGEGFTLSWGSVRSADAYFIQESTAPDFSNVVYDLALTDTMVTFTRSEGPHYFRVAPVNSYVFGTFCAPLAVYAYGSPVITSVSPGAVARGEEVVISGRSLDHPGNNVYIGNIRCAVSSSEPEELVAVMPSNALTDTMYVVGLLGTSSSLERFVVQLIAFVSNGNLVEAQSYKSFIEGAKAYSAFTQDSGVKIIPCSALETTNMSVYALIILGSDTGDDTSWAGGVPERMDAMQSSGAQVIGLGKGGYAYLRDAQLYIGQLNIMEAMSRTAYVFDPLDPMFIQPFKVPEIPPDGMLEIYKLDVPQLSILLNLALIPIGVRVHAGVGAGLDYYPMVDESPGGIDPSHRNYLWGYSGTPVDMTVDGQTCFMNVVSILLNASTKIEFPTTLIVPERL